MDVTRVVHTGQNTFEHILADGLILHTNECFALVAIYAPVLIPRTRQGGFRGPQDTRYRDSRRIFSLLQGPEVFLRAGDVCVCVCVCVYGYDQIPRSSPTIGTLTRHQNKSTQVKGMWSGSDDQRRVWQKKLCKTPL